MPAPAIEIQNAHLKYQQQVLLENFNLSLKPGVCTALLGPSGVGKSSLLSVIAGLESGISNLNPQAVFALDQKPLTHRISYMAQLDNLLPWLNILDNVLIGYRLRGEINQQIREQALALLEKVGLGLELKKMPKQLSGGMRQRVALVRTLIENKPVVLMDEPFASLDALSKLQLQNLAAALLEGKTVLLVTHDPLEALRLATDIYVMQHRPAQLMPVIQPKGAIPRRLDQPEIFELQAKILRYLGLS